MKSGQFRHEGTKTPSIAADPWCLGALVARISNHLGLAIVLITSIIVSFGCSNSRPLPEEKPLLYAPTTEKYWLCHLVTGIDNGDDIQFVHDCMLVTYSPTEQGNYTNFFLSEWSEIDSTFHFGMRSSKDAVWSRSGKWPLSVLIPEDSTHPAWRLHFSPKAIWLNGAFANAEKKPLSMRGRSSAGKHYKVLPFLPNVTATENTLYAYHIPKDTAEYFASIQLAEFTEAANLIAAGNAKAIYWIHFETGMDELSILLQLDLDGNLKLLGQQSRYHPHGIRAEAICKVEPEFQWTSQISHKTYQLGIHINLGMWNDYIVRPMMEDQEIRAGKNSFWMGAIEAVDSLRGTQAAIGNMYIFTH